MPGTKITNLTLAFFETGLSLLLILFWRGSYGEQLINGKDRNSDRKWHTSSSSDSTTLLRFNGMIILSGLSSDSSDSSSWSSSMFCVYGTSVSVSINIGLTKALTISGSLETADGVVVFLEEEADVWRCSFAFPLPFVFFLGCEQLESILKNWPGSLHLDWWFRTIFLQKYFFLFLYIHSQRDSREAEEH